MHKVIISTRREYELYVKHTLKTKHTMTNKARSAMMKLAMQCFDDGLMMIQGKLEVMV